MGKAQPSGFPFPAKRLYFGTEVPRRLIRRCAAAIAEEFHPAKIIRFGSHADGTPMNDAQNRPQAKTVPVRFFPCVKVSCHAMRRRRFEQTTPAATAGRLSTKGAQC